MMEAWRIVKAKYAATAFSGEGASRTGGRWNSRGVWLVYASSSRALAALESLVHLNPPIVFNYVMMRVSFADDLVERIAPADLPANWQEQPAPPWTKSIGDLWVKEARSAVLQVPSVVIPAEWNYLLNPAHSDFRKLKIGKPEPFAFDPRLI
jgi:RES domain-containing protein